MFVPVYEKMGRLGWAPHEVDAMELPVVGAFMSGPIVRGSRGLRLESDDRPAGLPSGVGRTAEGWLSPQRDHSLSDRIAAYKAEQAEQEAAAVAAEGPEDVDAPVWYEDG